VDGTTLVIIGIALLVLAGAALLMRRLSWGNSPGYTKLPDSEHLKEEIACALEWCATDRDHLSDASFREREDQGQVETLRYLGVQRPLRAHGGVPEFSFERSLVAATAGSRDGRGDYASSRGSGKA